MVSKLLVVGTSVGLCAGIQHKDTTNHFLANDDSNNRDNRGSFDLDADISVDIREALEDLAQSVLSPHDVEGQASVHERLRAISGKMDMKTAVKTINHQNLPKDVQALVKTTEETGSAGSFSEESLAKARIALNDLVEKAWVELDDKIIECKEYQEMNRATFDQITTDISRLVEQITDLSRVESESMEGISKMEMEIKSVEEELGKETKIFNVNNAKNTEELARRQADLDVFQFILTFTKCDDATSLLQKKTAISTNETRICSLQATGQKTMCFNNHEQQSKFNQMMSKSSRTAINRILAEVDADKPKSFLQLMEDPASAPSAPPSSAVEQGLAAVPEPTIGEEPAPPGFVPAPFCCEAYGVSCGAPGGGIMCSPDPPDCGLLHDKLSLMWGDYKDKVDELTMEMNKNAFMFEELKVTLNDQIKIMSNSKARFSMLLSESRSNLAADREEVKAKQQQKHDVDVAYLSFMKACCERVKWIMFQDMCALIVVRNAVLETSTVCPGTSIVDCDVDFWVGAKCSVRCDDSCPEIPDPTEVYECGGWQQITRKIVVDPPDECGLRCPALSRQKKCNQAKCEVDCVLSEWSLWSKCTAECEGGVKSRTRALMVKPLNGGMACNTNSESEACNTMSCDRDCTLIDWTPWSPCSVACGGGMQERVKHVLIPTRGFGKCPKETSAERHADQQCNVQDCIGDELCVAKQDLIIAIDGSGSVREGGFNIIKSYALNLLTKYHSRYFDSPAMKVGLIEFGNGVIMDDGVTVSPAMNVQILTDDLTQVKTALEGMEQKKGFTNMAQAFALAETMYTSAGRKNAQSALLVITDGKPSFQFQTNEMVEQLGDKGVQRYFAVIAESDKTEVETMRKWASSPWETNLLHIPGLSALQADQGLWAQKALTMFCPLSFSPSLMSVRESNGGFMHVKDQGYCGDLPTSDHLLSDSVNGADACAALAQGAGAQSFILGSYFRQGYCYGGTMLVNQEQWDAWVADRVSPTCPEGWTESQIYDFYAMMPAVE